MDAGKRYRGGQIILKTSAEIEEHFEAMSDELPATKRQKAGKQEAVGGDASAVRNKGECVQALNAALSVVDPELADLVFDGLLRLIAEHVPYFDSLVLSPALYGQLCDWISGSGAWRLLFRATRDGFTRAMFHERCNGEGPRTVTVARVNDIRKPKPNLFDIDPDVKVDDRIVGGFTSIAWSSDASWHHDDTTFLFCNRNNVERFERFPCDDEGFQVWRSGKDGPRFGPDLELMVYDGTEDHHQSSCQENGYCAENGGQYDSDTLVEPHGYVDWDGVSGFRANEIEVFAV